MRNGDALAAERRALPWVRVEKAYAFDTESGPKVQPSCSMAAASSSCIT
jgi:predicted dithiol-disulfide oxidoreductase (DUF899 family)